MVDQSLPRPLIPDEPLVAGDLIARYEPGQPLPTVGRFVETRGHLSLIRTVERDDHESLRREHGTWWLLERPGPTYARGSVGWITVRDMDPLQFHAMRVEPTVGPAYWVSDFGTEIAAEAVVSFEPDEPSGALPQDIVDARRRVMANPLAVPDLLAAIDARIPEDAS